MEDVAGVVVRVADGEGRQLHRRREVSRTVRDRLQAIARKCDLLGPHQPFGVLDLRLDADPSVVQP